MSTRGRACRACHILPGQDFYYVLIGLAVTGGALAIFLRKHFRRQARRDAISLLGDLEDDFKPAPVVRYLGVMRERLAE